MGIDHAGVKDLPSALQKSINLRLTLMAGRGTIRYSGQADYQIKVAGIVNQGLSDSFGGMEVFCRKETGDMPVTTIRGRVKDQAELAGIINTLHERRYPILVVKCLDVLIDEVESLTDK